MFLRKALFTFVSGVVLVCGEADAGQNLPEVDKVLTKAADKVHDFAMRAAAMQAHVAKKQQQKRDFLAAKKSSYEHMLETQAAENSAVVKANEAIHGEIGDLKHVNAGLEEDSWKLKQDNEFMHSVVSSVRNKVVAAKAFLNNSLHATDDSKEAKLLVLEPPKPKPTLSHFLAVATGRASTQAKSSLLQTGSRASARRSVDESRAEDLVSVLSQGLVDMASAQREGETQLKASFLAAWKRGEERRGELNATQTTLVEERTSLDSHQAALRSAKAHLLETRRQLQQRLQGVRVFAQRVGSATATTLKRVGAGAEQGAESGPAQD